MNLRIWIMMMVVVTAAMNVYSQEEGGMRERISLEKVKTFEGPYAGHFSPDGTRLALRDQEKVWIVEIETGKVLCEFKVPIERPSIQFSLFTRDWEKFAISFSTFTERPTKKKLILVETSTCKEIKTLYHKKSGEGNWPGLSFFRDWKKLAVVSLSGGLRIFLKIIDVESGEDEAVYEMDSFPEGYKLWWSTLSSDGRWLVVDTIRSVSSKFFPALYVIDLESGERRLLNNDDEIGVIKFSRDSKLLVTNSTVRNDKSHYKGSKTRMYEVGSGKLLRTFEEDGDIFDISPDNKLLAIGHWGKKKGKVSIHSLETGEKLEEKYHYKRTLWDDLTDASNALTLVHHIEFSADGEMLATGGFDSSVKLWRIERGKKGKKSRKGSWWRDIFIDKR